MPMTDDRRTEYMRFSGLTDEALHQAVGEFTLDPINSRENGLNTEELGEVRNSVRQVMADTLIIGAKYNKIARRTDRNVGEELDQDEIETDRAFLDELLADEYRFMNPFGDKEGKRRTIDVILNGRILFEGYGRGGYEMVQDSLQIHGDHAIYINAFKLDGHAQAKKRPSGEVYEQDLGGTYRSINTFAYRDGRWQATACQMTRVPPERDFSLLCHVGSTVPDEDD